MLRIPNFEKVKQRKKTHRPIPLKNVCFNSRLISSEDSGLLFFFILFQIFCMGKSLGIFVLNNCVKNVTNYYSYSLLSFRNVIKFSYLINTTNVYKIYSRIYMTFVTLCGWYINYRIAAKYGKIML